MAVDLTGKTVLITGASSGIGEGCAEAFAAAGCRLLLAARRLDRLDGVADRLRRDFGCEVLTEALDVRDREAVDAWVEGLDPEWSAIDILVNNAGLARGLSTVWEGDINDWEEMIDTNVKGLLWVTRAVLRGMVARGSGHVINIGSIAGHETYPGRQRLLRVQARGDRHRPGAQHRCPRHRRPGELGGPRVSSTPSSRWCVSTAIRSAPTRSTMASSRSTAAMSPTRSSSAPPGRSHANVREMILMPSAQAAAVHVHRKDT